MMFIEMTHDARLPWKKDASIQTCLQLEMSQSFMKLSCAILKIKDYKNRSNILNLKYK